MYIMILLFLMYMSSSLKNSTAHSVDNKVINEHVTVYVDSGLEYMVMRRPESNDILLITAIDHNEVWARYRICIYIV